MEVFQNITEKEDFLMQIRKSKLKDIELIIMNLIAKYMSIDIDSQLFSLIPGCLKIKIEHLVYNCKSETISFHRIYKPASVYDVPYLKIFKHNFMSLLFQEINADY